MRELIGRIIKNDYLKVYFFDIIAKVFSALISILIIRVLSVGDYAEYTFFFSISSFFSGVLGSGLGLAYTTYAVPLREEGENEDICLYRGLRNGLLLVYPLLSLLCYVGIKNIIGGSQVTIIFGVLYGMLLSLNQINTVFFQARKNYVTAGIIANIRSVFLSIALVVILSVLGNQNVIWIYAMYVWAIVVSLLITSMYIHKISRGVIASKKNNYILNMLRDGIWTILYMFVISAFNQLDVMMLKLYRTSEEVADYGVALKYYSLIISLLPAIQVVLRVNSASKEMKSSNARKTKIIEWTKKSLPISVMALVLGVLAAQFLFPILNGKKYDGAIVAFDILMIGAALSYITAPNVSIMVNAKKQKVLFVLSVVSFTANIFGNYFFIPKGGIVAAAITTIVAHFILNGGSTIYLLLDKGKADNNV